MGLWSFLRGLWPWRRRPRPEQPPRPAPQVEPETLPSEEPDAAPSPVEPPPPAPPREPAPSEPASPEPSPIEPEAAAPEEEAAEPPASEPLPEPGPAKPEEPSGEALDSDEEALDEEEDEDAGWEDEEVDDPDAPDPFITGSPVEDATDGADLAERRAAARASALSGEQRIYLSMPAGPGSLAEALEQLAAEGLVTAEFVSEGEDAPHILYRPASGGDRPSSAITSPEEQ